MQLLKTRKWKLSALSALVFSAASLPAHAVTLYVATNGNQSASYAQAQSSATPARADRAIILAQPNDVIQFAPGTYTRSNMGNTSGIAILNVNKSNITLQAQNRATANTANRSIIQVTTAESTFYDGIYILNQTNVVIDGFEIDGHLTNNDTYKSRIGGINVESSKSVTCRYNVVHDCGTAGIGGSVTKSGTTIIGACDYLRILNNVVYNNCFYSTVSSSAVGLLYVDNSALGQSGYHSEILYNKIYGNMIKDNGQGAGQRHVDGNGIIIDTLSGNATAARPATSYTDINGDPVPKTLVANNVVYGNGGRGIHVVTSPNVTVVNNSTYNNAQDMTNATDFYEIGSQNGKDCLFANNVSYGNPSRTSLNVFQSSTATGYASTSTITWRSNTNYNGTASQVINLGSASNSNMLNRDPHYFNVATGDLELGNYSPPAGIDNGSSLSTDFLSPDFLGVARPSGAGYDRGAYERVLAGAKTSPSASGS